MFERTKDQKNKGKRNRALSTTATTCALHTAADTGDVRVQCSGGVGCREKKRQRPESEVKRTKHHGCVNELTTPMCRWFTARFFSD